MVEDFWRTDYFGYSFEGKIPRSLEDQRAMKSLEATTKNKGNHYEVGKLWRYEQPTLPYNRVIAEMRLEHLEKKFRLDKELAKAYTTIIHGYLEKGYAKLLSREETIARN